MSKMEKKGQYQTKLFSFLDKYDRAFIVAADNVGSKQFQDIRRGLREHSVVLMGKNTMMKRCIKVYAEEKQEDKWNVLLDYLVGNVGIIFTTGDLNSVRDEIMKFKVGAPARVGLVAPNSVEVPAGGTGLDPSSTNFFQVLNIPTKINKGTVEITSNVALIKAGEKVGASEATLLAKLGIKPFSYGLIVQNVYDAGAVFDPKVLDITDADLESTVQLGIKRIAAACLALNYPTLASIPHSIVNGYKNVLAVSVETDYTFPLAEKVKAYLADPSAFASEAPAAGGGDSAPAEKEEEKKEEEEEEGSDEDMGFSLFD
ncbi:ribosomal protein P0 (A0) (L10E) [Trebouxia sp. C0009 RCD-2024]